MIICELIWQHLEEAGFLWTLRQHAVESVTYSLQELTSLDNRVEAHVDALRIAGNDAWPLCEQNLTDAGPDWDFAASIVAFEIGLEEPVRHMINLAKSSPARSLGVISALGWIPWERSKRYVENLLIARSSTVRRVGLAATALHRQNPGQPLDDAIADGDPLLRACAFLAVGELGRTEILPRLRTGMTDPDRSARFAAAWSATLLSPNLDSLGVLRMVAESPGPFSTRALETAIRRMDLSAAKAWQALFSRRKNGMRNAIDAAGAIGDPELVLWLIGQMNDPILARPAGEAFSTITGVDLAYEHLATRAPDGFRAGPTDDPADKNVDLDPDEHLPWPDPALIHKWWTQNQKRFQKGTRYLLGKPMSIEWLRQVLRIGRQRQRAAAALELAIRQPGQPLFEVRAPGFRQQAALK